MLILKKIKKKSKHLVIFSLFAVLLFTVFSGLTLNQNVNAANLKNFRAGNIMSDAVMSHENSMSVEQIQTFLESKNACNKRGDDPEIKHWTKKGYRYNIKNGYVVCMHKERFGGQSAAQIIWRTAQDYHINPQVLIVLLQKEQGLVTDTWPNHRQYQTATGFGCPDTAPCDKQYYGLKNQLRRAANLFRTVLDGGWTNYPVGKIFVQYHPNKKCGGTTVNIRNRATSALYRYTPYQPNQASLNAGYSKSTNACASYGNRNFWNYFSDWFGSTQNVPWYPAGSDVILNAEYNLVSALGPDKVLDIKDASIERGANVQLGDKNNTPAQRFKLTRGSDGYYTMTSATSGKVIDVRGGRLISGTNVHIWDKNSTCAQKWVIEKQADESYELKSACSGLNLDVKGGSNKNGANIQIYRDNNTPAQRWKLVIAEPDEFDSTAKYNLISTVGSDKNKVLDIRGGSVKDRTAVQIWDKNNTPAQDFRLIRSNDGYYTIINVKSNKVIDVVGARRTPGTRIHLWRKNGTCAQKWLIEKQADESYELKSSCSKLNLDVKGGSTRKGTVVQLWRDNNTPAQRWQIVEKP